MRALIWYLGLESRGTLGDPHSHAGGGSGAGALVLVWRLEAMGLLEGTPLCFCRNLLLSALLGLSCPSD